MRELYLQRGINQGMTKGSTKCRRGSCTPLTLARLISLVREQPLLKVACQRSVQQELFGPSRKMYNETTNSTVN